MKLKATISLPGENFSLSQRLSLANLVIASNSIALHDEVYEKALAEHLRVKGFGPAEYFTQVSDRMTRAKEGNIVGLDVTLSGVSVTARRAQQDFWDGLGKLDEIYREVATLNLTSDLKAQVFTRMALDASIQYLDRPGSTSLLETGPTVVNGSVLTKETSMAEVIRAEMEALIGDRRTFEGFLDLIEGNRKTGQQEYSPRIHGERDS